MSKRMMTIFAGLILVCGILLAAGVSLTGGVVRVIAARVPGASVGELKVNIKEWDVPTKGAHPHDPAVAPDGSLWFTEQLQNKVGRLDPASGKIELKKVQGQRALPYGIAINSKGVPFFCEFGTNKMAKIDPQSMEITEYKLPESARPRRMAIDAEDKIYFTDYNGGNLGRLDPGTGAEKMWPSPSGAGSAPYGITITPDGMVWYSESGVKPNTMVRFDPKTEQFARAAIPSGGGTVGNMGVTREGRIYIACGGVNRGGVGEAVR